MALEVSAEKATCFRCGKSYPKRKTFFPVSYAFQHKGVGYIPVCRECIEKMYGGYLSQCQNSKLAVRQMCRKLDLMWDERTYDTLIAKGTPRTIMGQYMSKLTTSTAFAGKSYDDTLAKEGTLWSFAKIKEKEPEIDVKEEQEDETPVSDDIKTFWGTGYTPNMYRELEQRRMYWMSKFPEGFDMDIGTEAIIRQICSLELDINRDRAAGRPVDKSVTALNTLLGSANLKPVQKKQEDNDAALNNTPMGVWLQRWEFKKPLPEIDNDCKDVNGLRRYVFTWMGHLCKMLGIKNGYEKLYEDEIEKLRVEKPEYDGDDDEAFLMDVMTEGQTDE